MEQTFHAIVCTHCQVRMTEHRGSGGRVQYFHCGQCQRWVSSTYADVVRSDSKFQARDSESAAAREGEFAGVKDRLERWLKNLDDRDPYQVLGVSPRANSDEVRHRYREQALRHHPDRGGSPEHMAELNRAYEQVLQHRETQPRLALPAQGAYERTWRPKAPPAQTQRVYRAQPRSSSTG